MPWHILDVGSIWLKEFASALGHFAPTVNWLPVMRHLGAFESWERERELNHPALKIREFPLQRGYSRFPISVLTDLGGRQVKRMLRQTEEASQSPLICTTPYYAPVAERWPGPVVYYQTDLTFGYHGVDPAQVRSLDRRMCRVAAAVCPNSQRVAHYMVSEADCDPAKIVVVPNATREENLFVSPPDAVGPPPEDVADLPRPIAGILGNLAANLDWVLLEQAINGTPEFSWLFVGPYEMEVPDTDHRKARERLLARNGRIRFVGSKPYGLLRDYARCVDVAVLPYRRHEPTYSGSSTRFYEHLAACRPMLSTSGFEELIRKEPLLRLADTPDDLVLRLEELRAANFDDGYSVARWQASRSGTWTARAATLVNAAQTQSKAHLEALQLPPSTVQLTQEGRYLAPAHPKFVPITPL